MGCYWHTGLADPYQDLDYLQLTFTVALSFGPQIINAVLYNRQVNGLLNQKRLATKKL